MRWNPNEESSDIIDRRGQPSGGGIGGLLPLLPFLLRSPIGWVILLVLGGGWAVSQLFFSGGGGSGQGVHSGQGAPAQDAQAHFVAFVLNDAQATWTQEFQAHGRAYRHAKLVLYTDATSTGCGYGRATTGPFYCPTDERVYLDLGFFRELSARLGARGDFAEAYVIAHELGHHVQKQLGLNDRVRGNAEGAGGASVRLELQADCFAGVWAHSTDKRNILEQGDIEEALAAAAAVGDDRLQRSATGTVSPESWTHGSSEQRSRWFRRGFDSGKMDSCDTFSAATL